MEQIIFSIMTWLITLFGQPPDPATLLTQWEIKDKWVQSDEKYFFEAQSSTITRECQKRPADKILFPLIIHGAHEVYGDGRLLLKFGNSDFKTATPFYKQIYISCEIAKQYSVLKWKVISIHRFFARFNEPVKVVESAQVPLFFNSTANLAATAVLISLSLFFFLIYFRRVNHRLTFAVVSSSLLCSLYFMFVENSEFGIDISMLHAQKIADLGLWLGALCIFYAFALEGSMSNYIFRFLLGFTLAGSVIIALSSTGDWIQVGTTLPMPLIFPSSLSVLWTVFHSYKANGSDRRNLIKGLTAALLMLVGVNDVLNIFHPEFSFMLLPFGLVGSLMGLAFSVDQKIQQTYDERDHLLETLDAKVVEKTKELQETLDSLKVAQSDLVQSAKLASLGTLSAGIAHEINNSINFINGAIIPLDRKIHQLVPETERQVIDKLLAAIKDGTSMIIEIVKSLRTYTGLNHAEFKSFPIADVFHSVLTILKSRLKGIEVNLEVEENLQVSGSLVGFNQIFMNLISNAIDVLPEKNPRILIGAKTYNNEIKLWVEDNGAGIPEKNIQRIFEPFFTTKDVGKGTGLGLHIIKKEVDRHNGKINVSSTENVGTRFEITIPIILNHMIKEVKEAA